MQPPTVSVLGCGWLGLPLAERLLADGYTVKGSTTTPEKMALLAGKGIIPYQLKLMPQPDGDLTDFLHTDILLIDIPPKARAQGDGFHSAQVQAVADAVQRSSVRWVIYISSTSVYPEHSRVVTEEDVTGPGESVDSGDSPSPLVVAEQTILQLSPIRQTTVLRCAGLMGYDRIPGKYVAGRTVDSGLLPVNYVHRDDAVGLIIAVLANTLVGTFNVVAPMHPTREAVYRKSCAQFGYALPLFVDSPTALPFKIVSGEKLTGQLNYSFHYPDPLMFQYGAPATSA